jgi:2'-5' RNA ligase
MNPGEKGRRLFLAIFVPDAMHAALEVQCRRWLPSFRRTIRTAPGKNLHLTLAFLGDVGAEPVAPLTNAVRAICAGSPPMRLLVAGCGAFPNAKRPRILWAGVRGDLDPLQELARQLREACEPLAPQMARETFKPHLTLARPNGLRPEPPLSLLPDEPVFGEWRVDSVVLASSELRPGGARYTAHESFPLCGRSASEKA